MLGAHPAVCTTVELTLFTRYTAPWIRAWESEASNLQSGRWAQGLPFLWKEKEFYDFLRGFLKQVYSRALENRPQATHILDKHPQYAKYVHHINWLLPNSRFIHLIRDGRDVVVSMMAAKQQIGFGKGTLGSATLEWKRLVRAAQSAHTYTGRYLEIRYEDLLTDTVSVLLSAFDFCDLPISSREVSAIVEAHRFEKMKEDRIAQVKSVKMPEGMYRKGEAGAWRKVLQPMQRYLFDEIAGDLLCELGYATPGWWAQSKSQTVLLPLIALASGRGNAQLRIRHIAKALLGSNLTSAIREFRSKAH